MPETSPPATRPRRSRKPATTRPADPASRAEGPDALRAEIARRAYEISQGEGAESDEANWLRAEREVLGA